MFSETIRRPFYGPYDCIHRQNIGYMANRVIYVNYFSDKWGGKAYGQKQERISTNGYTYAFTAVRSRVGFLLLLFKLFMKLFVFFLFI